MPKDIKDSLTSKNLIFTIILQFWRLMIFFLARIGDCVVFVITSIFRINKKSFSIVASSATRFVQTIRSNLAAIRITSIKHLQDQQTTLTLSRENFKNKSSSVLTFLETRLKTLQAKSTKKVRSINKRLSFIRTQIQTRVVSIVKTITDCLKIIPSRFGNFQTTIFYTFSSFVSIVKTKLPKLRHKQIFPKPVLIPSVSLPRFSWPKPHIQFHLPTFSPTWGGFFLGVVATFFFVFIPYQFYSFLKVLPNPRLLSQRVIPVTTQIFDRNGNLLYEIYDDENRKPLPLADMPDVIKHATIAIEDKDFYLHPGFSITGIVRAARETFFNHNTQGGSTITQQLIKNALLTQEVTFARKIREVLLAFWAERLYSKNQILEMYLNQVPYGGTTWGIEAAAETYFDKSVKELTLAEAAFLTGLPAAPTFYSPYGSRPELAKNRQQEVLHRMVEDGYITPDQEEQAKAEEIHIRSAVTNIKSPHFVMYIRELLTQKYGARLVDQGGLRITTTLDLPLQEKIQEIVKTNIENLTQLRVGNGAALVTNPQNGDILAMIGSRDYFDETHDGNVNVVISPRQPGSSIKVVNYAAALENGLTPATIIDDSPIAFTIPGQPAYVPVNYDGRFHGPVTIRGALANSYNIPAVKILNRIGVKTMIDYGKRMGITTWNDESRFGLSLTLGGGEVTLSDLSTVYGVLANQGKKVDLDPILKITDYTGRVYYEKGFPSSSQALSPNVAYMLSDMLSDNAARTPAFGPNSALVVPGKTVAVKTGTTNEKRDNWTMGYTPSYVVGVWVGNNDNTPMDPYLTSGITGAAPIWNQIMREILKDKPDETFTVPENMVKLPCYGRQEYFTKGTEPKGGCGPLPSPNPSPSPQ